MTLFDSAHKLTPVQKQKIVRIGAAIACVLVLVAVFFLGYFATGEAGSLLVLARLGLGYTLAGIALWVLALALPLVTFAWLSKTRTGKRLLVWVVEASGAPTEASQVQGAKTLNSGIILAALLISAAILFAGVLR